MLDDFDGLLRWPELNDWIETQDIPGSGPVTAIEKLAGGSQNNLFLLSRDGGKSILRRPPKHLHANSNATMKREAWVLGALKGSGVPHAKLYGSCDDEAVIGASFYMMAPLEGFSPMRELPGDYATDRAWRAAMGPEFVRAGAALGAIDYQAAGLEGYGKPNDWHGRQVDRWRSQLEGYRDLPNYEGHELPHVDSIGKWLSDHVPTDGRIGIIHGDFQFPNVMFSHEKPVISGLIDWELSTLGDPLLDLGWTLSSWYEEGDPEKDPMVLPWDGFLPRAELVTMYGEISGRDTRQMPWFLVLACYKLACILEGTYARSKAGQASIDMGVRLHSYALWLLAKAQQTIATGNL